VRLDTVDHVHYVFCLLDPRFTRRTDGRLEPAEHERTIVLPASVAAVLNALGPALLERWLTSGASPWTLRQVTETLGALGWSEAGERESWLLVRAWLLGWPQIVRVGADYWVPAEQVPTGPARTRLRVLPVYTATAHAAPAIGLLPEVSSTPEDSKPAILSRDACAYERSTGATRRKLDCAIMHSPRYRGFLVCTPTCSQCLPATSGRRGRYRGLVGSLV
jgi:hypothetical protein